MMRRRIRIGLTSWPSVASARQILCSARSACPTIEIPEATAPTRFSPTSFIRSAAMALRDADALPDGTSDKTLFVMQPGRERVADLLADDAEDPVDRGQAGQAEVGDQAGQGRLARHGGVGAKRPEDQGGT